MFIFICFWLIRSNNNKLKNVETRTKTVGVDLVGHLPVVDDIIVNRSTSRSGHSFHFIHWSIYFGNGIKWIKWHQMASNYPTISHWMEINITRQIGRESVTLNFWTQTPKRPKLCDVKNLFGSHKTTLLHDGIRTSCFKPILTVSSTAKRFAMSSSSK